MLISACVLGYGAVSQEFVRRFKELSYYKKRDSDTEGVRIHIVYEDDPNLLDRPYVYRYETQDNFSNVLNDGDQETKKEVCIGNDTDWLLSSDGHDLVFEAVDDPDRYLETLLALIGRGYWVIVTSDRYKTELWPTLEAAAKSSEAKLSTYENFDELFGKLDTEYRARLDLHRKNLYSESLNATPCGLEGL